MLLTDIRYERACRKGIFSRGLLRTLSRLTGEQEMWVACSMSCKQL